jgi:hypothetical protein
MYEDEKQEMDQELLLKYDITCEAFIPFKEIFAAKYCKIDRDGFRHCIEFDVKKDMSIDKLKAVIQRKLINKKLKEAENES